MLFFFAALYERLGLNSLVQGNYEKAERWFRRLESREPDSLRVLRNLGVILLAKGDFHGAEQYLLREEELYGPAFQRHCALADLAYARGQREAAVHRYTEALAKDETRQGGKNQAQRPFLEARLAICNDPSAFDLAMASGVKFSEAAALQVRGDAREAVALFEEAARLDPTNWPALNNAGTILLNELDEPARAVQLFDRALFLGRSAQVAFNLDLARKAAAKAAAKAAGQST